jgi:hypothetical protein
MANDIVEILLVEDNPNDVELALHALKRNNPANHIEVVRDGAEALEFLFATDNYAGRKVEDGPKAVLLDPKLPKSMVCKCCGVSSRTRAPGVSPSSYSRLRVKNVTSWRVASWVSTVISPSLWISTSLQKQSGIWAITGCCSTIR